MFLHACRLFCVLHFGPWRLGASWKNGEGMTSSVCVCLFVRVKNEERGSISIVVPTRKPFPHYSCCVSWKTKRITANLTWASFSPRRYEGTLNVVSSEECLKKKKKKDDLFCTALKLVISCFHIQRGRDKSLSRSSSRACTVYIV